MIHDDHPSVRYGLNGMVGVTRHDDSHSRFRLVSDSVDRDFEFTIKYFVNFFIWMGMLVNGSALVKIIMGKGHIHRVKIASAPAGQALDDPKRACINDRHGLSLRDWRDNSTGEEKPPTSPLACEHWGAVLDCARPMPARGKLIVLEGIDGSGKHTQLEMLARAMRERGIPYATIDFPRYEGFFGKMIAQYLNGEFGSLKDVDAYFSALLFAGDRLENKKQIEALLNDGKLVLADRYIASNLAHQTARVAAYRQKAFQAWIKRLEYKVYRLPPEDRVIYLKIPAARAQQLIQRKGARKYTRRRKDLQEASAKHLARAAQIFDRLARQANWSTVNCMESGQVRSPEDIHSDVMAILQTRILAPEGEEA